MGETGGERLPRGQSMVERGYCWWEGSLLTDELGGEQGTVPAHTDPCLLS